MSSVSAFLLDLFPLTDEVAAHHGTLGAALHRCALRWLLHEEVPEHRRQLRVLLRLAADLGALEPAVAQYLQAQLAKVESNGVPEVSA